MRYRVEYLHLVFSARLIFTVEVESLPPDFEERDLEPSVVSYFWATVGAFIARKRAEAWVAASAPLALRDLVFLSVVPLTGGHP